METYINDILVKYKKANEHMNNLREGFEMMRFHQLKLKQPKSAFWSSSGKFFRVSSSPKRSGRGEKKAKTIISTKAPQNKKELQKFIGQVNYLRRFISNLAGKTKISSYLIKPKEVEEFKWEEQHQTTFDGIKGYLSKPPVLMPPLKGWLLKLYLSVAKKSIGSLLEQNNVEGHEQVVYYLSMVLSSP